MGHVTFGNEKKCNYEEFHFLREFLALKFEFRHFKKRNLKP